MRKLKSFDALEKLGNEWLSRSLSTISSTTVSIVSPASASFSNTFLFLFPLEICRALSKGNLEI